MSCISMTVPLYVRAHDNTVIITISKRSHAMLNSVQLTARKWWRHKGSGASLVASTTTAHVCLTSLHFSSCTPHLLVIPSMFLRNASLTWCVLTLIRLEIGCIVSYCSFSAVDSSLRIRERKCKYAARLRWATSRPRCPLQLWIRDRNIR